MFFTQYPICATRVRNLALCDRCSRAFSKKLTKEISRDVKISYSRYSFASPTNARSIFTNRFWQSDITARGCAVRAAFRGFDDDEGAIRYLFVSGELALVFYLRSIFGAGNSPCVQIAEKSRALIGFHQHRHRTQKTDCVPLLRVRTEV